MNEYIHTEHGIDEATALPLLRAACLVGRAVWAHTGKFPKPLRWTIHYAAIVASKSIDSPEIAPLANNRINQRTMAAFLEQGTA
jgi:hypothetical protein